ncbi:MAG: response regulator [Holophagaceae bacterium]|nr:response regulator [Holophagaceae bacterium]
MPRLLLVDDNPSIHKIVVSLLAPTAIEISYAASSAEAFGILAKENPFDVVLLDTTLPEMDGWELLSRLRTNPKTAKMPIVMMAGVLEEVDPEKVEKAPIQAFWRKPVDLHDLADKVGLIMFAPAFAAKPVINRSSDVPSDLLILDEQDLAEDIDIDSLGEVSAVSQAESAGVGGASTDGSISDSEDVISLELEDLDLDNMEQLAVDESTVSPTDITSPDEPIESIADEIDICETPTQNVADYQDTSPEDFGPELFSPEDVAGSLAPGIRGMSSAASELLSDPKFIAAVAKAVAKNLNMNGMGNR